MWIRLKGIQVYGFHGVHAYEQEHGARFEIDVDLRADLDIAAESDDLADTLDYTKIYDAVMRMATARRFKLLEALSGAIGTSLLAEFNCLEVIVRIRKPGVALGGIVETVEIECQRTKS